MLKYLISFLSDTQVFIIMEILNDILHFPAPYPTINQQNKMPNLDHNLNLKTKSSPTNIPLISPLSKTVQTPCPLLKQREMQLEPLLNTVHPSANSPFWDQYQRLMGSILGRDPSFIKVLWKSVKLFIKFCVFLLTNGCIITIKSTAFFPKHNRH